MFSKLDAADFSKPSPETDNLIISDPFCCTVWRSQWLPVYQKYGQPTDFLLFLANVPVLLFSVNPILATSPPYRFGKIYTESHIVML